MRLVFKSKPGMPEETPVSLIYQFRVRYLLAARAGWHRIM